MHPLCTLRYSATHADKHHMVYRLDAVDAYEQGLVKQIEVASLEVEGGHNKAYVQAAVRRATRRASSRAKVELDVQDSTGVQPRGGYRRSTATISSRRRDGPSMPTALVQSIHCKAETSTSN